MLLMTVRDARENPVEIRRVVRLDPLKTEGPDGIGRLLGRALDAAAVQHQHIDLVFPFAKRRIGRARNRIGLRSRIDDAGRGPVDVARG